MTNIPDLVKPDFLVVGAMKAGTSSLWYHIRNHQNVCGPLQEVHFFDRDTNYSQGLAWYSQALGKGTSLKDCLIGEKTPKYGYSKRCAERIYQLSPEMKMIWIFREPVDRAFSHFLHARRKASEFYSFERAIQLESRNNGRKAAHLNYLFRSKYSIHVKYYLELFERKNFLFLKFEDFVAEPLTQLEKVFDFLEVPAGKYEYRHLVRNQARTPGLPRARYIARRVFGRKSRAFEVVTGLSKRKRYVQKSELGERTRIKLMTEFRPYNEELAQMTGLDLSDWIIQPRSEQSES